MTDLGLIKKKVLADSNNRLVVIEAKSRNLNFKSQISNSQSSNGLQVLPLPEGEWPEGPRGWEYNLGESDTPVDN